MNAPGSPVAEVAYRVFGHGPGRALVLPGWFGDEGFLEPLLSLLDPELFTYACMAYRGYGGSRHLPGEYTLEEISRDARGIADRLGWESFHLVGHSMGGKAALRICLDAPGRVRSVIAITPVGPSAVPFDRDTRQLFESAQSEPASRFAIINHSTGGRLTPTWVRNLVGRSLSTSEPEAFGAYFRSWADDDFASQLRVGVPVRVLVGRHDQSITEDVVAATFTAPCPDLRVQVIENAGHYPFDEAPLFAAAVIERLLAE